MHLAHNNKTLQELSSNEAISRRVDDSAGLVAGRLARRGACKRQQFTMKAVVPTSTTSTRVLAMKANRAARGGKIKVDLYLIQTSLVKKS